MLTKKSESLFRSFVKSKLLFSLLCKERFAVFNLLKRATIAKEQRAKEQRVTEQIPNPAFFFLSQSIVRVRYAAIIRFISCQSADWSESRGAKVIIVIKLEANQPIS